MPTPPTETPAQTGTEPVDESSMVPTLVQRLMDSDVLEKAPGSSDETPAETPTSPAKEKPEAKAKDAPAKPATDGKADDAAAKPDDEPPITVRGSKPKRPAMQFVEPKPEAQPAKPAAAAEPAAPDPKWEQSLDEDEKEMLADARYLEQRFPDKYKGWVSKTEKFLREHGAWKSKDDFDETAPEYRTFLDKNQPRLSRAEIREIEETRVADRLKKEYDPRLQDLQHELYVRDEEPKVEAEAQRMFSEMTRTALPKEVAEAITKQGIDEAKKVYALEIETAQRVLTVATEDIKEFLRLNREDPKTRRPLAEVARSAQDPRYQQHLRINDAIGSICTEFKEKAPVSDQVRNGKWFATRDEFNRMTPASRAQHWSFTNAELVDRMKGMAKGAVDQAIKTQLAYLEGRGFKRNVPEVKVTPDPRPPVQTPRTISGSSPTPPATDSPPTRDPMVSTILGNLGRSAPE